MNASADWREDFLQLFLSGRPDDVSAAYALKQRSMPSTLFKFFAPSEYAFAGLCNGTVWLAAPYTFNDPFDSSLTLDSAVVMAHLVRTIDPSAIKEWSSLGLSRDDLAALVAGRVEHFLPQLMAVAHEAEHDELLRLIKVMPQVIQTMMSDELQRLQLIMQRGPKIACFTEQADSMLLWSHYAASHTGFCVEYALDTMHRDALQRRLLFPVYYKVERFDFTSNVIAYEASAPRISNHAIAAAIHKAPEWTYEREWRIVNPDGSDVRGLSAPMAMPRKVHAGARMLPLDRARLDAICRERGIPVCDVTLSQRRYEVLLAS